MMKSSRLKNLGVLVATWLLFFCMVLAGCLDASKSQDEKTATSDFALPLISRSFPLPRTFFSSDVGKKASAMELLRTAGVEFPPNANAVFDRESHQLVMRSAENQMLLTQAKVDAWNWIGYEAHSEESAIVETKLREIIIPMIDFQDLPLVEALAFLEAESAKYDETGLGERGVRIAVEEFADPAIPEDSEDGDHFGFGAGLAESGGVSDTKILIRLTSVPLSEALRYTCSLAQLRYCVFEGGVKVGLFHSSPDLKTRVFEVPPGFEESAKDYSENDALVDPFATEEREETLEGHFSSAGISFFEGSSVTLDRDRSLLYVRNLSDQLDLVEVFLTALPIQESDKEWAEARKKRFAGKLSSIRFSHVVFEDGKIPTVAWKLATQSRTVDEESPLWERGVPIRMECEIAAGSGNCHSHSIPARLEIFEASLKQVATSAHLKWEIDAHGVVFREL